MPKPAAIIHPLRGIRKSIGVSQAVLAEWVGTSRDTIVSIETGRLKISKKMAWRVMASTGACPAELHKYNRNGKPIGKALTHPDGKPYSKDHYESWKANIGSATPEKAVDGAKILYGWLEILLLAASRPGTNKLRALEMSFLEWIEDARITFDLDQQIDAVLKGRPIKPKPTSAATKKVIEKAEKAGLTVYKLPSKKGKLIENVTPPWAATAMGKVPNAHGSFGVIKGRKDLYHD